MATKEITFDGKNLSVGGKTIPVAAAPKSPAPGKATGGGAPSGDGWLPWVLGGGGALLAHSITSPMFEASDEEKRKESVWTKLLRTLIPLGVGGLGGVAGYALGNALNKKAQAKPAGAQKPAAPAAPAAAPATNAAPVVAKATLPHPANVFNDSKGNPRVVLDGVSEGDYNDWIGQYRSDNPKELLQMRGGTMSNYGDWSHFAGKGLEAGGVVGGAVGAVKPWVWGQKMPSSVELRDTNAIIDALRTKMDAHKASLQRAQSAYARAQRAVDTTAMGRAQKAIETAKGKIKETKGDLGVAKGKLPQAKVMRSLRNLGVGAAVTGVGYGRMAMDYGNMAEKQQAIDSAVQQLIDQYGQDAQ